ncbi:MAG: type I-C CRISPR-associated protein Cas8c/Csd1, partial [Litorimonas sp.]
MTVLQELASLYDRRAAKAGWPQPGFSTVGIGIVVVLDDVGSVRQIARLGAPKTKGKGFDPQQHTVPAPPSDRRGRKIVPGRFWDPLPYALGVGGKKGAWSIDADNAAAKFERFREEHIALLGEAGALDLVAFRLFCETWEPQRFFEFPNAADLDGPNVAFQGPSGKFIHELTEAQALVAQTGEGDTMCLVSGIRGSIARLHIPIKLPFHDKQPPLVSFNEDAYESHGKKQGDNAPVSQAAAFAYATALNAM